MNHVLPPRVFRSHHLTSFQRAHTLQPMPTHFSRHIHLTPNHPHHLASLLFRVTGVVMFISSQQSHHATRFNHFTSHTSSTSLHMCLKTKLPMPRASRTRSASLCIMHPPSSQAPKKVCQHDAFICCLCELMWFSLQYAHAR